MSVIDKILEYLPTISPPSKPLSTEEKVKNTLLVAALYILLASIPIFGISITVSQRFLDLMWIFGSHIGTLATVGIAPVIVAGLFLQLLIFGGILEINVFDENGKAKYDSYVKFLSIIFAIIQSLSFIFSGNIVPDHNIPVPPIFLYILIFLQLFFGGLFVILLDDFCAKYGLTSGINLIIFVSICMSIALRIFNPVPIPHYLAYGVYVPSGVIPNAVINFINGNISYGLALILTVVLTFLLLVMVTYLQSIRIEIPLLYINIGGKVVRFPLNLLYTSVIPAIFLYGILSWLQIMLGGDPNSIIYKLIIPPNVIINLSQYGISYLFDLFNIFHIVFYLLIFIIGGALFSYLWIHSSGMDAKTISKYLQSLPVQSLKYRDPRIIEKTLEKYINTIGYLSGILIGLIAAISDILGIAVSGISLLLLVVIAAHFYNDLLKNNALQYIPIVGKYLTK